MSEYKDNHEHSLLESQPEERNVRQLQTIHPKNKEVAELRYQLSALEQQEQSMVFSGIQDLQVPGTQFVLFQYQKWIQAQNDYPEEMSCFGRRYPSVLVYDEKEENFYVSRINKLPSKTIRVSKMY